MLSGAMEEALNEQLKQEIYSAYLYMSMSAHSSFIGLKGFSKWFMAQYHEEMVHAMKIYEYILKQGGRVRLLTINETPVEYASPADMFEKTLEHERKVTAKINNLMEKTIEEKDHATRIFLQWYVSEQVEEEESANDILARIKLAADNPNALFTIDGDLGMRTVTVPTDFTVGVEAAMKGA